MKRVTFVLIGLVAIVVYIAKTKPELEKKVAQVEKISPNKHTIKHIYD
jgi:hypothetical protein